MDKIRIAGKDFVGIGRESTLAHDVWVMERIRSCGLEVVDREAQEADDLFVRRIFLRAAGDPRFFELMGGLLIPASIPPSAWTEVLAAETGAFFAAVTSPEDKATVKAQVVATLASFFAFGLSSMRISQRSSTALLEPAEAIYYEAPQISEIGTE